MQQPYELDNYLHWREKETKALVSFTKWLMSISKWKSHPYNRSLSDTRNRVIYLEPQKLGAGQPAQFYK